MRKRFRNFLALALVVVTIFSLAIPAMAAENRGETSPRASAYITAVWASASKSGGTVTVKFSITGTNTMSSLGATTIAIYNSSGTVVKSFSSSTTSGMMGYDKMYHNSSVSWDGAESGKKYYAIVFYKASLGSGYDTTSYTTEYT